MELENTEWQYTKRIETSGKKVLFFGKRAAEVDIFAKIGYNTQKKRHVPFFGVI